MGMLCSLLLAFSLGRLTPVSGEAPDWTGVSTVEFCPSSGDCEVRQVSPGLPAKICTEELDRPPWWARPFAELRLHLELREDSAEQQWRGRHGAPRFKITSVPQRGFCEWFGPGIATLCPDCQEEQCERVARPILGTRDFAAQLPPRGGCALLERLPDGAGRARSWWEWSWDAFVPAYLLVGFLLVDYWKELSASTTVHAAMGGVGSLAFVAAMLLLWLTRELRGTVQHVVPFGGLLTGLSVFFFTFIPTVREHLIGWLMPSSGSEWYAYLNARDPFFQLPIGWIASAIVVLGTCGTLSLGANISMKYFASAPEPEGEVPFVIGADGRRVDALPPTPFPQWLLGWAFWLLGAALLTFGSHSDAFSLVVFMAVLLKDHVAHYIRQSLMWQAAASPRNFRPLISAQALGAETKHHTQLAIEALQRYVKEHPEAVCRVREDSELRLRRFADGGVHCPRIFDFTTDEGRRICTVL